MSAAAYSVCPLIHGGWQLSSGHREGGADRERLLREMEVAVEAGADLVVGNHTHVVQAVEEIDGVQVFYGLGNFVFDQNWDLHHQQGVILLATFEGNELVEYQLIPTHVDFDGRVHIAGGLEAAQILDRIAEVSRSLPQK